jgi:serine/threonine protein kinase
MQLIIITILINLIFLLDFTTSNLLFQLSTSFDTLSEEEVYALLGKPQTETVQMLSGERPGPSAPTYVVDMPDFVNIDPSKLTRENIRIVDFDQSFDTTAPPTTVLGIPPTYMAPESIFDLTAGVHSDVWALGCAIFRMRAGYDLFASEVPVFDLTGAGTPLDTIGQVVKTIGELPAAWSHIRFDDEDGLPIRDGEGQEKESGELGYAPMERPLLDAILSIGDEPDGNATLDSLFWRPPPAGTEIVCTFAGENLVETEKEKEVLPKISHEEATCFHDLLSQIFIYNPTQRISAAELSRHPWFTGDFSVIGKEKEEDNRGPN